MAESLNDADAVEKSASLEERKFSLEERKLIDQQRTTERELALKEREAAIRETDSQRTRWLNPMVIGLLVAALGLFGNLVVAFVNDRASLRSSLIVEAMKAPDLQGECEKLVGFIHLGVLDDPHGRISRCTVDPSFLPPPQPVLGTYRPSSDTPWADEMNAIVNSSEVAEGYRFDVTFTVPKPPAQISPYPYNLITVYVYSFDRGGKRTDFSLPSIHGSWNPGERVTFSATMPKSLLMGSSAQTFLRFCVGSESGCIPSTNLIVLQPSR